MRRLAIVFALFVAVAACQLAGGYESFEGTNDAGTPAATAAHPCDAVAKAKVDAKGLTTLQLVKATSGACFWVDRYEVSVEQYRRFLTERGSPATFADKERCAWKAKASDPETELDHPCTKSLASEPEPFLPAKPIRCVDWCDAREFCRWSGKDLCASGNALGIKEPKGQTDEWGLACSPRGDPYPYGTSPVPKKCNIGLSRADCFQAFNGGECVPQRPELFGACEGASGAWEMIGNVAEWVFSCTFGDGGPEVMCTHRGGSFADSLESSSCLLGSTFERNAARETRNRGIGFRCCTQLTPAERVVVVK